MKDIIAVVSPTDVFDYYKQEQFLKREALLFQRIAIPHLNCCTLQVDEIDFEDASELDEDIKNHFKHIDIPPDFRRYSEWLIENKIIFIEPDDNCETTSKQLDNDNKLRSIENPLLKALKAIDDLQPISKKFHASYEKNPNSLPLQRAKEALNKLNKATEKVFHARRLLGQIEARVSSALLRKQGHQAYALFYRKLIAQGQTPTKKKNVLQIVIESLPTPDASIPWEHIIDYRSDPDTQGKFLALKRWMTKTTKQNLPPNEIEEELEWLLHEYERHLKVHRMKVNHTRLQTTFTVVPEFLDHLIHLEFGEAAKLLFKFRKESIDLLEAEMKLPNQEVAYIVKAREEFK